jgi:hypothetical protein
VSTQVPLVMALDDPPAALATVGGKGASLARLARAGFPVPPGFHVTTRAYLDFVAHGNLREPVMAAMSIVDVSDPATFETASERIGELFAGRSVSAATAAAIAKAYVGLGDDVGVAVRSSATAEDLPGMSFAGQQDTYLNIRGEASVLDAVKRCWGSLWTPRAIGYRAHYGHVADQVQMGVVVQQFVRADAAGVLFTVDPVAGGRDQVVLNASWGLGEAIVGGQVTPDIVVVDRAGGGIIDYQVGSKAVMTVPADSGTREQDTSAVLRDAAALTADEVGRAAAAGPFAKAAGLLEDLAGVRLTAKRVERSAEASGAGKAAAGRGRAALITARTLVPLPPSPLPDKLYAAIDGTGVPVTAKEAAGRNGKGEDGRARTREVKLAVFFTQDKLDEDGYPVRDPASSSYLATFEPASIFADLVEAEGIRRGAGHIRQFTILGDGAAWIWNIATAKFPEATQIVDLWHAREHLHDLARVLEFMLDDQKEDWLAARLEDLDYGDIDGICAAARAYPLIGVKKDEVDKALGYFQNNAPRMRYKWFRSRGLFVGSGVVEAGCKGIVAQRLKLSGMNGPSPEPTPSSPCAAARPAASGKRSGSGPAARQPPPDPALTGQAPPLASSYPPVTYKIGAHPPVPVLLGAGRRQAALDQVVGSARGRRGVMVGHCGSASSAAPTP